MASETLSQRQIDQLFEAGAAEVKADEPAADAGSNIRTYDFHRPNLISKDRLRALEAKYGVLCKSVENWLTTRARGSVELQLLGVEQFSYTEFTLSLPNPTASYVYDVTSSPGQQVVIDFGRTFSFFLVERLLGSNDALLIPDRALTVLERLVVQIAADHVALQLDEIWKSHLTLGLSFSRFEAVPELLRTANKEDPVLVANIEVRAPQLEGTLLLCVPFGVIEKFLQASGTQRLQVGRGTAQEREADRAAMRAVLLGVNVDVAVRTPTCSIALADVARLEPGVSLRTGLPANTELIVHIEDTPRFIAEAGRSGRALAMRIVDHHAPVVIDRDDTKWRPGIMAAVVDPQGKDVAATAAVKPGDAKLGNLFQVTLPITIELGRTRMSVQDVLELGRGSVITLERLVGEPVDVIVGDRHFADGEVVVIGEQFGVRITRIHSPQGSNGNGNGGNGELP